MMYIVCGMVVSLYPQCARLCQAETSAENADLGFTFDEKTGTLSIYGKGMLGSVDKYNYSNYFQHELGFKDNLDKIRKVVIGDEVTGIYESCFRFMLKKLEEVEIGANVAEIQKYAFLDCPSIRQITISPQNPYFKIMNHGLYSADGKTLYFYPPALGEKVAVIAPGTKKIRECARGVIYPAPLGRTCYEETRSCPVACCGVFDLLKFYRGKDIQWSVISGRKHVKIAKNMRLEIR